MLRAMFVQLHFAGFARTALLLSGLGALLLALGMAGGPALS
jgi:hypothetical protein